MKTDSTFRYLFCLIALTLLTGCGSVVPLATPADVNATAVRIQTTTNAQSTETATPPPPATQVPTTPPTVTATPTLPPLVTAEGLRLAYIVNGNLYVQGSGGKPNQLTNSGKDSKPIFSEDGEKIVFLRKNEHPTNKFPKNKYSLSVFSVNLDGSQLQELITADLLTKVAPTYNEFSEPAFLAFVPGSHHLLFNTHQAYHYDSKTAESSSNPNNDLFWVDADSAEVKWLFPPGDGGHFGISPNGKMAWMLTQAGQIQIINLDGKIIHQNLATYATNWPEWPRPDIFWTADSKKLNILPLSDPLAIPEPRIIWLYPINNDPVTEIHFGPPPMAFFFSISADSNSIVYTYKDPAIVDSNKFGIYLGNLRDGTTHLIAKNGLSELPDNYSWSPDSQHFVIENLEGLMLGDIYGNITPLSCRKILGWVDASHYLCSDSTLGEIGKETKIKVAELPAVIEDFTFVFVKH
jgi:predicted small lipoprotein YifL